MIESSGIYRREKEGIDEEAEGKGILDGCAVLFWDMEWGCFVPRGRMGEKGAKGSYECIGSVLDFGFCFGCGFGSRSCLFDERGGVEEW